MKHFTSFRPMIATFHVSMLGVFYKKLYICYPKTQKHMLLTVGEFCRSNKTIPIPSEYRNLAHETSLAVMGVEETAVNRLSSPLHSITLPSENTYRDHFQTLNGQCNCNACNARNIAVEHYTTSCEHSRRWQCMEEDENFVYSRLTV